ncbi:peptidase S8, subtilisin-related [Kipferlia bialata]|uniref:Peptidase S8, subtilisin-related n=1 Tax=Kipferlia bialata TaxID=797122 RepID=A0A9K3D234_9EUKA|nr:peptidase S8, subtilisin-related [Kipferlia bialata]|eukprot:g7935.t1
MFLLLFALILMGAALATDYTESTPSLCLHAFESAIDTDLFIELVNTHSDISESVSVRKLGSRLVEADCAALDTLLDPTNTSMSSKSVMPRLLHSLPSDTPMSHQNYVKDTLVYAKDTHGQFDTDTDTDTPMHHQNYVKDTHGQVPCTDPECGTLWHLSNPGYIEGYAGVDITPNIDIDVLPAWDVTKGEGVTAVVVDQGVDGSHPDLATHWDSSVEGNYCTDSTDNPYYPGGSHGTSCAGLLAGGEADGSCGMGVAPDSNLSGRRVLCSAATYGAFASSLSDHCDRIDVFSNSWGPTGCTGSGCIIYGDSNDVIIQAAIEGCLETGRNGKGSVYFFASGNEASYDGDPNDYPYSRLPQVLSISSVGITGKPSYYSNHGAAVFAVTPSSGLTTQDGVSVNVGVTAPDQSSLECNVLGFTGTSAATPIAAGVGVLALAANPDLQGVDIRHVLANSCRVLDVSDESWTENGAGVMHSEYYGYGLLQASAAVTVAQAWGGTGQQETLSYDLDIHSSLVPARNSTEYTVTVAGGVMVETVVVKPTLTAPQLTGLSITVVSPSGTESVVLRNR